MRRLKAITRKSELAKYQTGLVCSALTESLDGGDCMEIIFKDSLGDRYRESWVEFTDANPGTAKRKWTYELELAVQSGVADLAIHSGKDLPSEVMPGTVLRPVMVRENATDVLVTKLPSSDADELRRPRIATGSLRRTVGLRKLIPNAELFSINGNVTTRLTKLRESDGIDGVVLASAGVNRLSASGELDLSGLFVREFPVNELMPCAAQGTLVAQYRDDHLEVKKLITSVVDATTESAWLAERACLEGLSASCDSVLGIYASVQNGQILLRAWIGSQECDEELTGSEVGAIEQAEEIGRSLSSKLLKQGAENLIKSNTKE
ncbi:hydroxymethylbilane synthase [Rubripirellula reticaptiva]|uniref:Hydroxymethylbilane synthase n=1 Tax=Rubripirellula reticaptiva TaxID=2528013 RepID=A0A5C6F615_9BACT|nr:hydroxymethylbilane synthase [Rubripirellula reticaptiva]TWU56000.1 Porphobilinogen deaminase [Rubripirellula reticaptiva]